MSVEITGMNEILKNLEAKLGKNRTTRVVNKALRNTGDEIVDLVKESVSSYMDTGATYDEVVRSNVKGASSGVKEIDVGWRGDMSRWRLVHLNEFGYTRYGRYIRPAGIGKVQAAVDLSKKTAVKQMQSDLEELAR